MQKKKKNSKNKIFFYRKNNSLYLKNISEKKKEEEKKKKKNQSRYLYKNKKLKTGIFLKKPKFNEILYPIFLNLKLVNEYLKKK